VRAERVAEYELAFVVRLVVGLPVVVHHVGVEGLRRGESADPRLGVERAGNVGRNRPHFRQRRVDRGAGDAELVVRHVDPAAHAEIVLARPGQLIQLRAHDAPGNVHAHHAAGDVECKAEVDPFGRAHAGLAPRVQNLDAVQPVRHADRPLERRAAGRLAEHLERGHQRAGFALEGLHGEASLGLLRVSPGDVEVLVEPLPGGALGQIDRDAAEAQAVDRAALLVHGEADAAGGQEVFLGLCLALRRGLAFLEIEPCGPQRRNVLGEEHQARGEGLRRHDPSLGVLDDPSLRGRSCQGNGDQIGAGPGRGVDHLQDCVVHGRAAAVRHAGEEELLRLLAGVQGKRLLDLPLRLGEVAVGLGDAAMGPPGVLVVEKHVAPRPVEIVPRKLRRLEHGKQRLGLDKAFRGVAGEGRLPGRGAGAVFPVGREVAAGLRNLVLVAALELRKQLARRGDPQLRPRVPLVPFLHEVGQLRVGRAVVPPDAVAQLHDLVGKAALLQLLQVGKERLRLHLVDPVQESRVEPRVSFSGSPAEHLFLARRRDPVERLIAPVLQSGADAVDVVGAHGEVLHSVMRHGRHDAPGPPRHVADHGRVDGHAAFTLQSPGTVEQAEQFFRPAQPGEHVAVEGVEVHLARLHRLDELPAPLRRGLLQVAIHGPQDLGVPLELGARRVAGRAAGNGDCLVQVLPLELLNLGLHVRVADVHVRVRQDVELPVPHRLKDHRSVHHLVAGNEQRDLHVDGGILGRQGDVERLAARAKLPGRLDAQRARHARYREPCLGRLGIRMMNLRPKRSDALGAFEDNRRLGDQLDGGSGGRGLGLGGGVEADFRPAHRAVLLRPKLRHLPAHVPCRDGGREYLHGPASPGVRMTHGELAGDLGEVAAVAQGQLRGAHGRRISAIDVLEGRQAHGLAEVEHRQRGRALALRRILGPLVAVDKMLHHVAGAGIGLGAVNDLRGRQGRQGSEAGGGCVGLHRSSRPTKGGRSDRKPCKPDRPYCLAPSRPVSQVHCRSLLIGSWGVSQGGGASGPPEHAQHSRAEPGRQTRGRSCPFMAIFQGLTRAASRAGDWLVSRPFRGRKKVPVPPENQRPPRRRRGGPAGGGIPRRRTPAGLQAAFPRIIIRCAT